MQENSKYKRYISSFYYEFPVILANYDTYIVLYAVGFAGQSDRLKPFLNAWIKLELEQKPEYYKV